MAYTKYSLTPANNTATPPDGAPEGMLPSAVNDTMRDMMAQIRDCGDGIRDGTYTMTAAKITGGTITGVTLTGNTFSNPTITGVSTFAAGTVSAPAITTSGDTNTGIFFPAADTIAFTEGGVESMRIDSSGNVGIGVTPSAWSAYKGLNIGLNTTLAGSTSASVGLLSTNAYFDGSSYKYISTDAATQYQQNTGEHIWRTAASGSAGATLTFAERMRIDSSGNVGIGTSSPSSLLTVKGEIRREFASNTALYTTVNYDGISVKGAQDAYYLVDSGRFQTWYTGASERMRITSGGDVLINATATGMANGGIQSLPAGNAANVPFFGCAGNSSSSAYICYGLYSTSLSQYQFYVDYSGVISARSATITNLSDAREKTNIKDLETGLAEVLQLKPKRYDWKDNSNTNMVGFIAQEVLEVLPDLVGNYRVEEGQEPRLSLRTGDILPTLVKAIQELNAKVEQQAAEIALLKSK